MPDPFGGEAATHAFCFRGRPEDLVRWDPIKTEPNQTKVWNRQVSPFSWTDTDMPRKTDLSRLSLLAFGTPWYCLVPKGVLFIQVSDAMKACWVHAVQTSEAFSLGTRVSFGGVPQKLWSKSKELPLEERLYILYKLVIYYGCPCLTSYGKTRLTSLTPRIIAPPNSLLEQPPGPQIVKWKRSRSR